jgi:hypothetical protein
MDDDLRAELEKLIAWCRRAQVAVEWQNMPTPQMVAAQVGDEVTAILARHPEPAAPSETDRERVREIVSIGAWETVERRVLELIAEIRAEHAKQVAPSEREKRLEDALHTFEQEVSNLHHSGMDRGGNHPGDDCPKCRLRSVDRELRAVLFSEKA